MIQSFLRKDLERFFRYSDRRGLPAQLIPRIARLLDILDAAVVPEDMNLPGFRFHPLKGDRKGVYSIAVSANCRLTFRFQAGNATHVNLEDYH